MILLEYFRLAACRSWGNPAKCQEPNGFLVLLGLVCRWSVVILCTLCNSCCEEHRCQHSQQPHCELVFMTWQYSAWGGEPATSCGLCLVQGIFCRLAACFFLTENGILFNLVGESNRREGRQWPENLAIWWLEIWHVFSKGVLAHLYEADKALFSLKSSHWICSYCRAPRLLLTTVNPHVTLMGCNK